MGTRRNKRVASEPVKDLTPRCVKKPYDTREAAERARRQLYAHNRRAKSQRGPLDVYYCTTCSGWHVGHALNWWTARARRKRRQG